MSNPLRRLDEALIAGHQWIVDTTDRPPRWWSLQMLYLAMILYGIACYWTRPGAVWIAMAVAFFGVMWFIVKYSSDVTYHSLAELRWVLLIMPFLNFFASMAAAEPFGVTDVLWIVRGIVILSFHYFAACGPPKPKFRRNLSPQT